MPPVTKSCKLVQIAVSFKFAADLHLIMLATGEFRGHAKKAHIPFSVFLQYLCNKFEV